MINNVLPADDNTEEGHVFLWARVTLTCYFHRSHCCCLPNKKPGRAEGMVHLCICNSITHTETHAHTHTHSHTHMHTFPGVYTQQHAGCTTCTRPHTHTRTHTHTHTPSSCLKTSGKPKLQALGKSQAFTMFPLGILH